jgi:anti-sigma B factor antagonist
VVRVFSYDIHQEQFKTVVRLAGEMDIDVTEIMEDEIAPRLLQSKAVEIDFSQIRFIDSSGIGLLLALLTHLRDSDIRASVHNPSPQVKEIFELLQLPEIVGPDVFL